MNNLRNSLFVIFMLFVNTTVLSQIISYQINETITGIGELVYDIDNDGFNDYQFEIIELSPDVYAARVVTFGSSQFLDNSTFGYPDALDFGENISGYFNSGTGVLGTFNPAGQFNGMGDKYLGIKISSNTSNHLGWIKLNCSTNNDSLSVLSCGYNSIPDESITAGQTIITGLSSYNIIPEEVKLYPNPCIQYLYFNGIEFTDNLYFEVFNLSGQIILSGSSDGSIDVSEIEEGKYILRLWDGESSVSGKFTVLSKE